MICVSVSRAVCGTRQAELGPYLMGVIAGLSKFLTYLEKR